jgi:hypothetical protein
MPLIGQFIANFTSSVRCLYVCADGFYSNSHYHSSQRCAGLCAQPTFELIKGLPPWSYAIVEPSVEPRLPGPVGHYCGEGTITPQPCPVGTYQPLPGARMLASCIR